MKIITGNTQIEFSLTLAGQFMQAVTKGTSKIIKTTPRVDQFLAWLNDPKLEAEREALKLKRTPVRLPYTCVCCDSAFDHGCGVMIEKKEICLVCREVSFSHFEYFRNVHNLSDSIIYYLPETTL